MAEPTRASPLLPRRRNGHDELSISGWDTFIWSISHIYHLLALLYSLFIPSKTFLKFFIAALIPAISDQLIPLFYTGSLPDESALAISSQFIFISIILEVIQESITNSLFFFIGQNYDKRRRRALQGLKICLLILLVAGSLLTGSLLIFVDAFVNAIDTPENITLATSTFLKTSALSFPLSLMNSALLNYFYITTSSLLIPSQACQVVWSFVLNYFFFGKQGTSLNWSVGELGYFKVIQSGVSFINNIIFLLVIERIGPGHFLFRIPLFKNIREHAKVLFSVSWGNCGDSAVRNFFYFMVTLKFINKMGETEAGAWNLLNTIIWGVLLLPTNTVANYVKVRIGNATGHEVPQNIEPAGSSSNSPTTTTPEGNGTLKSNGDFKKIVGKVGKDSALSLSAWLIVIGISSGLMWPTLANYFSKSNEKIAEKSTEMFAHVGWIFIVFSFNNAMDALFFGTGRTKYIFYQSLFTNLIVYFVPWMLYTFNVIQPSYWLVLGLYIAGMLVDFVLTSIFCVVVWNDL